jgi:RNA polymerase sigma-70 factor (ECF subfamily)
VAADDAELVRRCRQHDPGATRALIERYQGDVFGLCVRMLHQRHDAEDVTQEVFLRVFRSLHRWDGTRPLRPWIMGIAINRCRTWLGQRGRRPELVDHLHETVAAPPVNDDTAELSAAIQAAVQGLRPDYRAVFVLFHEQNQPYEEIADTLARPVGTVKTWLHRARLEVLAALRRLGLVPEETTPQPRDGT